MKLVIVGLILALCLTQLSGCDNKVEYDFPSDIKGLCNQARDDAKHCIQSKGQSLDENWSCAVVKNMRCDRKASSGYWCWYDPSWKMYVGGLAYPKRLEVGCNPQTGGEVHSGVLKHEFGHHWLMSNNVSDKHPSQFKDCFMNWNEPRTKFFTSTPQSFRAIQKQAQEVYADGEEGDWISISGFDENNQPFQIDFVVFK
jgi:hypothetical protein